MKYNLDDEDLQKMSDKMRELLEVKYKDEIGAVEPHIVNALCQNYVLQCKTNNVDIDKLFKDQGIVIEEIEE